MRSDPKSQRWRTKKANKKRTNGKGLAPGVAMGKVVDMIWMTL